MVPNFALSLSFSGIALLRRSGEFWAQIQEVPLDGGDLEAAVLGLRNRAEGLDPLGAQVTLIIPNEQIRYLQIPDPGGEAASQDIAVRTALDGATPYDVADLVYDFTTNDGQLYIAALAKETLDEAEGFALQNGFEPVAHAAIAPEGQFDGAVFFGPSSNWAGPSPDRLPRAVEIIPADEAALTPIAVAAPEVEPEPVAAEEPVADVVEAPEEIEHPAPQEPLEAVEAPLVEAAPEAAPAPQEEPVPQAAPQVEMDLSPPVPVAEPPKDDVAPVASDVAEAPTVEDSVEPEEKQAAPVAPAEPVAEIAPDTALAEDSTPEADTPQSGDTAAAPMAFSTIRASRDGEAPARHKDRTLSADDQPTTKVKSRFTPVATRETRVKEAGITQAHVTEAPSSDPDALAPAPAEKRNKNKRKKARRQASEAPKVTAKPSGTEAAGDASALARLAALRARTEPSLRSNAPAVSAPQVDKADAPESAPAPKAKPVVATPPKAASVTPAAPIAPAAGEPVEIAVPAPTKSALGRLASLRAKPQKDDKPEAVDPKVATAAAATLKTETEKDRMTVFGARNNPKVGGKPRFLGLLLTAALLLFMAGVAAWASVFLDDGLAGLFRSEPKETAIASAPQIAPQSVVATPALPLPSNGDDKAGEAEVQLAALDSRLAEDPEAENRPTARAVPVVPRLLSPEEAAATYAATGIWQRAPLAPLPIPTDGVDDIYVASIDPKVQESDAVALPDPNRVAQEPVLETPRLPPPAGQRFDMDSRGLVRATPQGAISPDGVRVFAGLPPAVPPQRPSLDTAAPAPQAQAEDNAALGKLRPKLRPNNLIEERERATLSGRSRAELAAIRPVMRPKTAQEVAVAEEPEAVATARAVGQSLTPVGRPRNMAAIVKRAERSEPPQAVQTAAIAPRTVTPAAPTSRGVAQSATVRNAINLNKISLIGVYGTPAARRALVRLPNGKYKKVKVGDRLDGGRVAAIGNSDLRYTKSGRNVTLKMPRS